MAENGEFSPDNCRQFAQVSAGGVLKIWDTATGVLKQEYAPSSHLTATCSVIAWAPNDRVKQSREGSPSKKKRKSATSNAVESLELIAMGTTSGSMMLYSCAKAELNTQMHEGHTGRVTGICWSADGQTIYSCSVDRYIIEWDVEKASVKHKWKGDKGKGTELYSIQLCHTQRHLLTAGHSIKLWDLDTRQVLQSFVGHVSDVFKLYQVPSMANLTQPAAAQMNGDAALPHRDTTTIEGSYIISTASSDRKISVWQVNTKEHDMSKDLIASFSLPEAPIHVQIRPPSVDNQLFQLIALTLNGKLVLFEHVLNGRQKKPMSPRCVLELATKSTAHSGDVSRQLSIASASLTSDIDRGVVIVYEDFLRPVFEKLSREEFKQQAVCLLREDPARSSVVAVQENVSKVKTPLMSKDVTILTSGYMAPTGPARADHDDTETPSKKKRRKSTDMSIEERLNAMEASTPTARAADKTPRTDNLSGLLEQGLQSQDKALLNNVLQRTDGKLIRNTVSRLSPSVVVLLIRELERRVQGHAQSQKTVLLWFNAVLTQHQSFLTSLPDAYELLHPLRQIMYPPPDLLPLLMQTNTQLKSFLVRSNASSEGSETFASQTAAYVYNDDSESDEDVAMGDVNHETALSEDEWGLDESVDSESGAEDDDDDDDDSKNNDDPSSD